MKASYYAITSPPTPAYNCIAWAAGDDSRWWWPSSQSYWPASVVREETLDAFVAAYEALGYSGCNSDANEQGYEKVAIFVNSRGVPTHAARQLESGMWTSKLGKEHDIAHVLNGVAGTVYGTVGAILKRARSA